LCQGAKGVNSINTLIDLFESIERFLNPLDIYTWVPTTPAMDEEVIKIMMELISTLALATKELNEGQPSESVLADMFSY
jgi:hypothetical protein